MLRLFCCLLGILLLAPAQRVMAQAQTNVPAATTPEPVKPAPKPDSAQVDSEIDTDELASSDASPDLWAAHQADALLDVVSCYLDKASLQREVALETKGKSNDSPNHLIEVRIRLLKTLAMHNALSHCK